MAVRSGLQRCAAIIGVLALLLLAARADQPDLAAMTQREIALLEFYGGGSPLTTQERQQAAQIIQSGLQNDARAEIAADAQGQLLLNALKRGGGAFVAETREAGRLGAQRHMAVNPALQQQEMMEAQIIEAHDPAIVFESAHKRLISAQTVRVLRQANALGAKLFDVPAPGPDFSTEMTYALRSGYAQMDDGLQEATAHVERDLPYAAGFLRSANPQKRAAFVQDYRAKIMAAPDPAGQQLRLAEVMAMIGLTAYRHNRGAGGGNSLQAQYGHLQEQNLLNQQLRGAMRSYSPACNVTSPGYNFTYCH